MISQFNYSKKKLKRLRVSKKKSSSKNTLKSIEKYKNSPKRIIEKLRAEGKIV